MRNYALAGARLSGLLCMEGSAEEYFRRSAFNPFLDHVLQEMRTRFPEVSKSAALGARLLPAKASQLNADLEADLLSLYGGDPPSPATFHHKIIMWKTLWKPASSAAAPDAIASLLEDKRVSRATFPNVYTLLHLLLLIPVTSATVEWTNSALKFVKTERRSRMGECRLDAVVLLFADKDIEVDLGKVLGIFMPKRARRMTLSNPLE